MLRRHGRHRREVRVDARRHRRHLRHPVEGRRRLVEERVIVCSAQLVLGIQIAQNGAEIAYSGAYKCKMTQNPIFCMLKPGRRTAERRHVHAALDD